MTMASAGRVPEGDDDTCGWVGSLLEGQQAFTARLDRLDDAVYGLSGKADEILALLAASAGCR